MGGNERKTGHAAVPAILLGGRASGRALAVVCGAGCGAGGAGVWDGVELLPPHATFGGAEDGCMPGGEWQILINQIQIKLDLPFSDRKLVNPI